MGVELATTSATEAETQIHGIIREMTIDDYDQASALWNRTKGVGLSGADSREKIARFLERNPGLSFVWELDGQLLGTALCGNDGRRGYLYHLAVAEEHRRGGVGRRLVQACLSRLRDEGIDKCHLFVFADNELGAAFWSSTGWTRRGDIAVYSMSL